MLSELTIGIKGAGEMASGIAHCLHRANIKKIFMMEAAKPLAVRRRVSFCSAIEGTEITVEGITAVEVFNVGGIQAAWNGSKIPVIVDPEWKTIGLLTPEVLIDAIIAKKNLGTRKDDAPFVIGLGPGFKAGEDVDLLIETNRGHNLGRHIFSDGADDDTGIPGNIGGFTVERVLRSPGNGHFITKKEIGDSIIAGEIIGTVGAHSVRAGVSGVIRGLIKSGIEVRTGLKIGDIDPRNNIEYCSTISDKARALGGSILVGILTKFNSKPGVMNPRWTPGSS